jgi:hypothetical protein
MLTPMTSRVFLVIFIASFVLGQEPQKYPPGVPPHKGTTLFDEEVFHQIGQAKFAYSGSILSLSKCLTLTQQSIKTKLAIIEVKIDSKISCHPDLNQ